MGIQIHIDEICEKKNIEMGNLNIYQQLTKKINVHIITYNATDGLIIFRRHESTKIKRNTHEYKYKRGKQIAYTMKKHEQQTTG